MAGLTRMAPRVLRLLRIGSGIAVVAALVATVGAAPFIHGLTSVSPPAIIAALALTGIATAAAAWRWRIIAGGFGLDLSWLGAVAAYYRSQLLNSVLPGGVLGDVHRAYRDGRRSGDIALSARAVATERIAGQVVQIVIVVAALEALGLASPLHGLAWIIGGFVAVALLACASAAVVPRGRRFLRRELGMLDLVFRVPRRSLQIVASSILVVASHATLFVIACVVSGVTAPPTELFALALIALTAGALPINVGGWGPREGAAASTFAIVGLGAGAGVAASTAFGILALIAVLPGVGVLVGDRLRIRRRPRVVEPENTIESTKEEVSA